jgi:hypothetical protein
MGLFEKKYCDICGEKIGLLGNRKVEDGNICSKCAKKLSPFFTGRKKSTVNEIKDQLAYREDNRKNLESFNPTRSFGYKTKVLIDDGKQAFVVSRHSDFRADNADIIPFGQVTGARYEVEEHRSQKYYRDAQGRSVSYNPPRYEYSYEFTVKIDLKSERVGYFFITFFYGFELLRIVAACSRNIIAGVEHIRDLGIAAVAFPRCRGNYILPVLITFDNVMDLFELIGVRK